MHLIISAALLVAAASLAATKSAFIAFDANGKRPSALKEWFSSGKTACNLAQSTSIETIDKKNYQLYPSDADGINFDNVIIHSNHLPKVWNEGHLIEYALRGGNIIWFLSESESEPIGVDAINVAKSFGRKVSPKPSIIKDYSQGNAEGNASKLLPAKDIVGRVINSNHDDNSIETMGAFSHQLLPDNPLVFPIITGFPTAISENALGTENVIVSSLESRVGSRITIITAPLGDTIAEWMSDVLSWATAERGILKLDSFTVNNLSNGNRSNKVSRILDQAEIIACMSLDGRAFLPSDAQIEIILMEPLMRFDLKPISASDSDAKCLTTGPFTLPNHIGTLSLKLQYQRHGFSHIHHREHLVVRDMHHDEWDRFRPGCLPYYFSWLGMMFGATMLVFPLLIAQSPKAKSVKSD